MTGAPYPEPRGYQSTPGFVKSNPLNNDHYLDQMKDDPWYPVLKRTHDDLTKVIPGYNISQIKQKFGGLRYYITYPDVIPTYQWSWLDTEQKVRDEVSRILRYAEAWVDGYEAARST